jgi:hypothetical protein
VDGDDRGGAPFFVARIGFEDDFANMNRPADDTAAARIWALVNADVINKQKLWENGTVVWWAGPVAANGQVENQEKGMVVDPAPWYGFGGEFKELLAIDIPADFVFFPFDGENVEFVAPRAFGQAGKVADSARTRVARPVNGSVNFVGFAPDVLHNVDFTGGWPGILLDVCAQHPEGRPDAVAVGQFHARFNASIRPGVQALSFQAG